MSQVTHKDHLCLHNIAFERNHHYLFAKLNHTFNPGNIVQVRGQNGSGKSTLLRILAGLIEPHEGKITWNGQCIIRHRENYIESVNYLGHSNGIKPILTVYENLSLHGTLAGLQPTPEELNHSIKKAGLALVAHTRTQNLSVGQLRRLCLARLILKPAKVWLLDEPTTALDSLGLELLNNLLREHAANHGITIIATHQPLTVSHLIKTIYLGEYHAK